jgi:hypothetical protein
MRAPFRRDSDRDDEPGEIDVPNHGTTTIGGQSSPRRAVCCGAMITRRSWPAIVVALVAGATSGVAAAESLQPPPPLDPHAWYTPVVPARLLETRAGGDTVDGEFHTGVPLGPGETIDVDVVGRGGVPASGVDAVVVNVTGIAPSQPTHVTVHPTGGALPLASNLNVAPGDVRPNLVMAKVGVGGRISLSNAFGTIDLVVDIAGYVPADDAFTPLVPFRLLDTRPGEPSPDGRGRPGRRVGPGGTVDIPVLGRGGVPASDVAAVVLNVTAVGPTEATHLTVFPAGSAVPVASNLNVATGVTLANLVVAKLGAGGMVSVSNAFGSIDVIGDVAGYFPTDGTFHPLSPTRLFESRPGEPVGAGGTNFANRVPAGEEIVVDLNDVPGIDADVSAVVLNVTAVNPTDASHITVWPTGVDRPLASNLNLTPGVTAPNSVIAKVGAGGHISFENFAGSTDLVIDLAGYFELEYGWLRDVATADGSTCALDWLGEAWCWGLRSHEPYYFDLPDTTSYDGDTSTVPYRLGVYDDVVQIGVSWANSCVLRAGGTVWCWGPNAWGQLGNGTVDAGYVYEQVVGLDRVVELAVGYLQSCALRDDGSVWCWGRDFSGAKRSTIWRVPNLPDAVRVSVGTDAACAVRIGGTVVCWGVVGNTGVLGDGSGTDSPTSPRPVAGITDADWVEVSGLRACATRTNGEAVCWGNSYLGGGSTGSSLVPVAVIDGITGQPADDIIQIDGGDDYACALRADAQVYCWGSEHHGERGLTPDPDDSTEVITTPVPGLPDIVAIFADRGHACAMSFDLELFCWGDNRYGQIGNGTFDDQPSPQFVFS